MPQEIERKFLLKNDLWRQSIAETHNLRQGYFATETTGRSSIRVRIADQMATLNIKSLTLGISRQEFEYPIPLSDAEALLLLCLPQQIHKARHRVPFEGFIFEIDEFFGDNQGLIVAELELPSEDAPFPRPPWLGEEVSADPRYYNVCLLERPYSTW
jgi:adenylate cyclase